MTLYESLKPFFAALSKDEKLVALRAVSHYILFQDYKQYRDRIHSLSEPSHNLFYLEVRNFVKSSFECRKIWLATRYGLSKGVPFPEAAQKFQADLSGLSLVWKAMSPEDQEVARLSCQSEEYGSLDPEVFADLVRRLDVYCGKVAYLKLRFLVDNDPAMDNTDLRGELLAHGIQAARFYEHSQNLPLIENYSKAAIQNHALNLIQHYTSESRACVRNITVGCGTCVFCVTDKPQRCPYSVADYQKTAVSLDGTLRGAAGVARHTPEDRLDSMGLLQTLKQGTSPEVAKVVDLVFGSETDEKFEVWLTQQHDTTVDALSQNPKRLVKLLCRYLDLSPREVAGQLRVRYESYRKKVA